MEPYLGVVILKPTKKAQDEEAAVPTVVVQATVVVAKDEASAKAKLLRLVPDEHANKDSQLEPRVIPFR